MKAVLNDGEDVPYFEGICDLEGRPVEGEAEFYDPAVSDGPVKKPGQPDEKEEKEAENK